MPKVAFPDKFLKDSAYNREVNRGLAIRGGGAVILAPYASRWPLCLYGTLRTGYGTVQYVQIVRYVQYVQ